MRTNDLLARIRAAGAGLCVGRQMALAWLTDGATAADVDGLAQVLPMVPSGRRLVFTCHMTRPRGPELERLAQGLIQTQAERGIELLPFVERLPCPLVMPMALAARCWFHPAAEVDLAGLADSERLAVVNVVADRLQRRYPGMPRTLIENVFGGQTACGKMLEAIGLGSMAHNLNDVLDAIPPELRDVAPASLYERAMAQRIN